MMISVDSMRPQNLSTCFCNCIAKIFITDTVLIIFIFSATYINTDFYIKISIRRSIAFNNPFTCRTFFIPREFSPFRNRSYNARAFINSLGYFHNFIVLNQSPPTINVFFFVFRIIVLRMQIVQYSQQISKCITKHGRNNKI